MIIVNYYTVLYGLNDHSGIIPCDAKLFYGVQIKYVQP